MSLDPALLRVFIEVSRVKSMSGATQQLGIQQSAVSRAIARLEECVGGDVFERRASGLQLTALGFEVLSRAERVLGELEAIAELGHQPLAPPTGDMLISASEHVAAYLLGPAIGAMRKEAPDLVPRLFTGPAHMFVPEIASGRHELGLFFKVEPFQRVDRVRLARFPCQLVVAPHRAKHEATLSSFIGSREIDDRANARFPTLEMLRRTRPATRITVSLNSLEAHKHFAMLGLGVAILPLFVVRAELDDGRLQILHPEYTYTADLELVTRRGQKLSRGAARFLLHLRRSLKEL